MNGNVDHQKWLDSLNVGDEVAVDVGRFNRSYVITKVVKITPTRRMVIDYMESRFDSYGREIGARGRWEFPKKLIPVTDEIKDIIKKKEFLMITDRIIFENLTTDQLERIIAIVKEGEK